MDVMYPMDALTRAAVHSRKTYPHTPLRLYVEAFGGVIKPVLDRNCSIGVIGSLPLVPDELQSEHLAEHSTRDRRQSSHPLAKNRGVVSVSAIAKHVQLVLSDRTVLSEGRDFGVLSPLTWRLADLGAKHAFLKAGLGWGHMPLHMVKADLDSGVLVKIRVEAVPRAPVMPMSVSLSKGCTAGACGPSLHRATQAEVSASVSRIVLLEFTQPLEFRDAGAARIWIFGRVLHANRLSLTDFRILLEVYFKSVLRSLASQTLIPRGDKTTTRRHPPFAWCAASSRDRGRIGSCNRVAFVRR